MSHNIEFLFSVLIKEPGFDVLMTSVINICVCGDVTVQLHFDCYVAAFSVRETV